MAVSGVVLGSCALLCLVIATVRTGRPRAPASRRALLGHGVLILAAGLAVRAAMAQVGDGGAYDVGVAYRFFGDQLKSGGDVYGHNAVILANYPPVVYWWWAAASAIASTSAHLFAALARAPFWILDAAVAPVLLAVSPLGWRHRASWCYALNPIAIAVATLHGQFDALPATATLLAVVWSRERPRRAGWALGVGVAFKPWPAYLLPLLWGTMTRQRRAMTARVAAVPVLAFAVYFAMHPAHIIDALIGVVFYNPHRQGFGTSHFFPESWGSAINPVINVLILIGFVQIGRLCAHRRITAAADAALLGELILLGVSPSVSDQYLVWPFALLLFTGRLKMAALLALVMTPATVVIDVISEDPGANTSGVTVWLLLPVTLVLWGCAASVWRALRSSAPDAQHA